ncbi:MAG: ornithine cyclodeaminase family protein [Vicinamibacterales bacterium]
MVLLLSESDIASVVSMADGVRLVEDALRQHAGGGSVMMPRISTDLPGNGGAFRIMSAVLPSLGFFGLKTLTGYPGRRLPGETYFAVLLFSCETGALRGIVAASRLTGIRTGAASGVAAKYLSRVDSRVLGVIGAGVQARFQVAALMEVRALEDVRVFDIDEAKALAFARTIAAEFQVPARAVADAHDAVAGCDLVVTATAAKTPVFDGTWLDEGAHISGVGSNSPNKRELDGLTFNRSRVVVDFKDQVLLEAGDLQHALSTGAIRSADIDTELGHVITGRKPGRRDDREITLFKSVGMAIQDIAAAAFAYEQALVAGVGTHLHLDGARAVLAAAGQSPGSLPKEKRP